MNVDLSSIIASGASLQTQVSTAVLCMNLNSIEIAGEGLTKILEQSVAPNLGQSIDIKL